MTIDDISYLDPESINGLNLYAYCLNNPVKYSDKIGKFAISTILIGCLIAFAIGSAVSAVSQGLQYGWGNISIGQVLVDGLFAAVSVALAATGISLVASVVLGAAMGFGQYAADSAFHNEAITLQGSLIAIALGAAAGAFSGAGARNASSVAGQLSGRANTGMKALITTAQRYGVDSKQMTLVNNLYRGAIKEGVSSVISSEFTRATKKIYGTVILSPAVSTMVNRLLNHIFEHIG